MRLKRIVRGEKVRSRLIADVVYERRVLTGVKAAVAERVLWRANGILCWKEEEGRREEEGGQRCGLPIQLKGVSLGEEESRNSWVARGARENGKSER